MDVTLPNGTVIQNVPDGTTQTQLLAQLDKAGIQHGVTPPVPSPKAAPAPPATNTYADIIKSTATGIGKGVAAVAGIPGDISDALDFGANAALGHFGLLPKNSQGQQQPISTRATVAKIGVVPAALDSAQINSGIQDVAGQYHTPQTTGGKYAETIASFAPAALGGEGSLAVRAAKTVIPAVASEGSGEVAEDLGANPTVQNVARVGGALVGAVVGNPVATGAIRSINAAAVGKGFSPILDPETTAAAKIRQAVENDGGPSQVGSNIVDWQGSGASGPTLVDVGGNNVRRLVRAAASGGDGQAQNVATTYADKIRANFQPQVLAHTRVLTPTIPDSAGTYADKLEQAQSDTAKTNYAAPYAEPATVTPEMVSALQGPEGRGAISQALADASANRDIQQMGELQDLKAVASEQGGGADPLTGQRRTIQQALGELSAGSLDRVRIAMRDTGRAFAATGRNSRAGGYFGRVNDIDTALDQTPGLQPARAAYSQMQAGRDAVDVGGTGLTAPAADYSAEIANLASKGGPPNIGPGLQVGHRQALVDKLSAPSAGFTSAAKNIATSDQDTANLASTFGPEKGAQYQAAVGNEVKRVGNADFVSPNTGSQTALRTDDTGLLASVPLSKTELLGKIIDTLRGRGATLTDAERTAIVRLGTSEANLRMLSKRNPQLSSLAIANMAARAGPQN